MRRHVPVRDMVRVFRTHGLAVPKLDMTAGADRFVSHRKQPQRGTQNDLGHENEGVKPCIISRGRRLDWSIHDRDNGLSARFASYSTRAGQGRAFPCQPSDSLRVRQINHHSYACHRRCGRLRRRPYSRRSSDRWPGMAAAAFVPARSTDTRRPAGLSQGHGGR